MSATPPDSGEREVLTGDDLTDLRNDMARGAYDGDLCGYLRPLLDEVERGRNGVLLSRSLAQRILAALELTARFVDSNAMALADELRKVLGETTASKVLP